MIYFYKNSKEEAVTCSIVVTGIKENLYPKKKEKEEIQFMLHIAL